MARKGMIGRVGLVRSKTMSAIRTRNTYPELVLRSHLAALGLRYRLHKRELPGSPDIVFVSSKVAVFCDGDFWHGRHWQKRKAKGQFKVRNAYWTQKIESNIARDRRNNRDLRKLGWIVMRFWSTNILKNASEMAAEIKQVVHLRSKILGKQPHKAPRKRK